MPCQQSVEDAKHLFRSRVAEAMNKLMKCGYSRERATNALLREISRGEVSTRPTDEEMFDTMKRLNLGIEEASKAITIGKAMKQAMTSSISPAQAILSLANKLSFSNLIHGDSSHEKEDCISSSIHPNLRIEPVVSTRKTIRKNRGLPNSKHTASRSAAGRKRSIDEIVARDEKKQIKTSRSRADSVAQEVKEKINSKRSSDDSTSTETPPVSATTTSIRTPVVRAKRGMRGDDVEIQNNVHKRIRGSEAS